MDEPADDELHGCLNGTLVGHDSEADTLYAQARLDWNKAVDREHSRRRADDQKFWGKLAADWLSSSAQTEDIIEQATNEEFGEPCQDTAMTT